MTYAKRNDIPVQAGETAVELDDGHLVAVLCTAERTVVPAADSVTVYMDFKPRARWIDATGASRTDGGGAQTAATVRLLESDATARGAGVVVRECLMASLGEPLTPDPDHPDVTIIPWSPAFVAGLSIRQAIASASVAAPDASDVL